MNKTNWIAEYGDKKGTQKLQGGGGMTTAQGGEAGAGAGAGAQGPDLEGMLMEYSQTRDPQLAVAICDMLVEMMAAQQGGGAPPEGGAAAPPAEAPPMAKKGTKMSSKAPIF